MAAFRHHFPTAASAVLLLAAGVLGCSDQSLTPVPQLQPLVGVWEAQVLEVPDPEDPSETIDIMAEGGSFTLSVLATGEYTAVFDLILLQGFESGEIEVSGSQITLTPTSPAGSPSAGTWGFSGDVLIVDVIRSLDLDGDQVPEVVPFHYELSPRTL